MKTYKFKLYSNHENRELHKTIDSHAHVWNHFVALCRRHYAIYGKYPGKKALMRHLTKLKRLSRYAHWNLLPSQSLQDVIDRLDKAYQKKFSNPRRSGRPRFKKRKVYKSFTLKQAGWKLLPSNRIKIGKTIYSYFKPRDVFGNPKRCTIKRDAIGDVYIIILTDYEEPDLNRLTTGNSAGFDFGLKRYLTGHRGIGCSGDDRIDCMAINPSSPDCNEINAADSRHDIESPEFFKRSINSIKRANRAHSRTKKKSNNRERTRLDLARKHRKIERQRADFHYKLAHQLTDAYDEIRLEDLNLQGMKSLWGRKVGDLGFADFVKKLVYIAKRKGVKIKFIGKWYPSSKTCSTCGAVNESLNLRDRNWQCNDCGTVHDRDRNAAINIYRVGASTLDGEDVRGGSPSSPC